MVTCEDSVPHPLPYLLRQGLKVLATQVALQLTAMAEIDRLTEQMHLRTRRLAIISQLAGHSIAEAFFHGGTTVLDLIPAAGAALRVSGTLSTIGETAPEAELLALADGVLSSTGSHTLVSPNLSVDYPELAAVIPSVAGVMMVALGSSGDFLAWIRPEIPNTVLWAGPAHGAVPEVAPKETPPLAAPNETQQGVASRCQGLEEAKELARDLDEVLRRRAEAQLANLALYDQLTGLPNRRLLMENIEQALALVEHRDRLIVLFIDLDGFKRINDTLGHDAGDATLTLVGERILRGAREQDTVARIGGDEFVVLCSNIITTDANILAQSLVDVIAQPTTALGFTVDLTASIGIASAASAVTALELLHHADSAMYRAKAHGRNRTSR